MNISPARLAILQSTLDAWNQTGFPFLKIINGMVVPLENNYGGDAELFYFIPLLARTFGLPLERALWWWDIGFAFCGAMIAVSGFWCLAKTNIQKTIAALGVIGVGVVSCSIGDTYLAPFVAFSFAPWVFVFLQKQSFRSLYVYSFLSGFGVSLVNSMRMFGGYALGIALITAVLLYTRKIKKMVLVCGFLLLGIGAYHVWFSSLLTARNNYLTEHSIPYGHYELKHAFWHSIYIGLGFITNDYGLYYSDNCAMAKAVEVQPEVAYCSPAYDAVLRDETFKFCLFHVNHVLRVMFAKAGVLFYYLLLFANVGLVCAFFYRKPWYLEISYLLALIFSALPGLVTIPIAPYLVGFFTVATFYGVHSTLWALQQGLARDLRVFYRKLF